MFNNKGIIWWLIHSNKLELFNVTWLYQANLFQLDKFQGS